MKPAAIFLLAASVLCLTACAYPDADAGGNPNHMPYAGDAGSLYDKAANPPSDNGRVTYDATGPLAHLPSDETLPPATMPSANPVMPIPRPSADPAAPMP
jgi:hypothetical protein